MMLHQVRPTQMITIYYTALFDSVAFTSSSSFLPFFRISFPFSLSSSFSCYMVLVACAPWSLSTRTATERKGKTIFEPKFSRSYSNLVPTARAF